MNQRYIIIYIPKRLKIDGTNNLEYAKSILKRFTKNVYSSEFRIYDVQLQQYVGQRQSMRKQSDLL